MYATRELAFGERINSLPLGGPNESDGEAGGASPTMKSNMQSVFNSGFKNEEQTLDSDDQSKQAQRQELKRPPTLNI